jgi:hypothetical protein
MSASVTPVALSKARWGACSIPNLMLSERTIPPIDKENRPIFVRAVDLYSLPNYDF